MKLAILALALAVTGCASTPYNADSSAAQIKAMAADNKATVACTVAPTPWGIAKSLIVSVDETGQSNATVFVDGDCAKMSINTAKPPPAPKVGP